MTYLNTILYTILFIIIAVPVLVFIFDFFDIPFENYGNFLIWGIALAIFNAILPYAKQTIFTD
jgi:hypothetical protein